MMKTFLAAAVAVGALAAAPTVASAQTVDVLVMQADGDPNSLERGTQVQNAMLIEFQKSLNAPAIQSYLARYGIQGLDVIDEKAAILQNPGYDTTRTRRSDEELLTLVRQIPNQSIDAVILYTLYARAVADPYTKINLLQASLQYRVFGRDGRFLGGDTTALDTSGIPFTGCAAAIAGQGPDPLCVRQLVADNVSTLAADAGNRIALEIASLVGSAYGRPVQQQPQIQPQTGGYQPSPVQPTYQPTYGGEGCNNLPTAWIVTFKGIDGRQMNAVEEFMRSWNCYLDHELEAGTTTTIKYRYKSTADRVRILRNIRQMFEAMGVFVDVRTQGERELLVEAVNLRTN